MTKIFKYLLIWRKRAVDLSRENRRLELELFRTKNSLNRMYQRFDGAISHNKKLSYEIDILYKRLEEK